MSNRSADATIKGFLYQFNVSIEEIFKNKGTFTVEGIEDLDYESVNGVKTAIQYKYYSSKSASPSVLRDAILPMIVDYKKRSDDRVEKIKYKIFGFFKNDTVEEINLEYIKKSLVKGGKKPVDYQKELDITDDNIEKFLNSFEIVIGTDFDEQKESLIKIICERMKCTVDEAELIYYPQSLFYVNQLAISKNVGDRIITHDSFIKKIDKKIVLLNVWLSEYFGREVYAKKVSKKYFKKTNLDNKQRFFVIDCDEVKREDIYDITFNIQSVFYKVQTSRVTSGAPHIILHNCSENDIAYIKNSFRDLGYKLLDGHSFKEAKFRAKDLCVKSDMKNKISLKFIDDITELNNVIKTYDEVSNVFSFSRFNKSKKIISEIEFQVISVELESVVDIQYIF